MSQCPPKEYLAKHFSLEVPSASEASGKGSDDYNIVCWGVMEIDRPMATIFIRRPDAGPKDSER